MINIGIDIAKLNHFASAISSDGEILIVPFKFTNDYDGFYLLLSKLDSINQNSIIIGIDSTAHYGDNLVCLLLARDLKVCVLTSIKTSVMRKNNVRKTNTDKVNTYIIAKTLMVQDNLRFMTMNDLDYIELKELGRFRQKTVKQHTLLKIQLTSYVNQFFPKLQYFFKSGLHQKAVGINDSSLSIQITQTIAQIELLDAQLFGTELQIANLVTCLHSVLMTISGISVINDGMILGEIGDIHHFSSSNKLLAFAGLDPTVYQSDNYVAKKTRMSKCGSKVLRYALMNAAHNVVKNNATFEAYYKSKRAEYRLHYSALGHCASKLVRVIWKMLTDEVEFNLG